MRPNKLRTPKQDMLAIIRTSEEVDVSTKSRNLKRGMSALLNLVKADRRRISAIAMQVGFSRIVTARALYDLNRNLTIYELTARLVPLQMRSVSRRLKSGYCQGSI